MVKLFFNLTFVKIVGSNPTELFMKFLELPHVYIILNTKMFNKIIFTHGLITSLSLLQKDLDQLWIKQNNLDTGEDNYDYLLAQQLALIEKK